MGPFWMSWSQKKMLHNQTQISVEFVLAQLFATLINAIMAKRLNQMEDMDWSVKKQQVKQLDKKMSINWSSMALTKRNFN